MSSLVLPCKNQALSAIVCTRHTAVIIRLGCSIISFLSSHLEVYHNISLLDEACIPRLPLSCMCHFDVESPQNLGNELMHLCKRNLYITGQFLSLGTEYHVEEDK